MELIDIGANLSHSSFREDLPEVLARATTAGLSHIMVTGADPESSAAAVNLAGEHAGLLSATAGCHPHHAKDCDADAFAAITRLAEDKRVVAVGETGLDYHRNYSPRREQMTVFVRHLALAAHLGKPLFLHQRDAHEDFYPLLRDWRERLPGGVVHCFTDSRAALEAYLDLDMYIGITGWVCDERRGRDLQGLVALIPPDRLLIETDAPYLLPRSLATKPANRRCEPCHLPEVLRTLAIHCGRDAATLARETTANARRLFGLAS